MHLSTAIRLALIALLNLSCAEDSAQTAGEVLHSEFSGPAIDTDDSAATDVSDGRAAEREQMVREQIEQRGIGNPHVLRALRTVPRHWFVLDEMQRLAYADQPLPIGEGQTISQPAIVALMTELLEVEEGDQVLEVGTGSGYQAAVLSEMTPHVYSIEIVEPLARRAALTFQQRGYDSINIKIGDGYAGWPEHAPFDAIIVTAAPDHVPQPLIDQLKPGGRMVIPLGKQNAVQQLRLLSKSADGTVKDENLIPVRFVPMTGKARQPGRTEEAN